MTHTIQPSAVQCLLCGAIVAGPDAMEWHNSRHHPQASAVVCSGPIPVSESRCEPYTPRANSVTEIVESLRDLSDSEVEIIAEVVRGIRAGRKEHGTLDLATDTRDYGEELWQEVRDGLFYIAARAVKARRQK